MAQQPTTIQANPLTSFMRQPKIYIRLPSGGEYWPSGSLAPSETGDYPVYSMTAKDELMLKVPDAVMSGQAVVDVIQHCVPHIKNAWNVPSIDLDIILIAIRIATYGEQMTTPIMINGEDELEYSMDLRIIMDALMSSITWDPVVPINEQLTVFVRPMNYKQLSESAVQTFETQKMLQIANDTTMSEDEKVKAFKESFNKLTSVTIGIVEKSIFRIDSSDGSTDNPKHIKEFVENVDKEVFNKIQGHLDTLKDANSIKPVQVTVTEDMRARGITEDVIEVPLVFDPATFFV
jgi:hypothetical protein